MITEAPIIPTPTRHHRFHLLDAVRGVAAILVFFWHAPSDRPAIPGASSYLAVDLFFCLSGFVIAFSYERRLMVSMSFRQFLLARAIRLLPVYVLGIILGTVAFLFQLPPLSVGIVARLSGMVGLAFLMIPNFGIWKNGYLFPLDFPAWSMFYEAVANVAFAWLLRRRLAGNGIVATLYILPVCLMVHHILQPAARFDVGHSWVPGQELIGFLRVSLSFFAGVLALRTFRQLPHLQWSARYGTGLGAATLVGFFFLLLSPIAAMRTQSFALLTVGLFFPVLVLAGALSKPPRALIWGCSFLGDLSYPLYLLQVPILCVVKIPWLSRLAASHRPLALISMFFFCVAASHMVFVRYDVPVRAYLRQVLTPRES